MSINSGYNNQNINIEDIKVIENIVFFSQILSCLNFKYIMFSLAQNGK